MPKIPTRESRGTKVLCSQVLKLEQVSDEVPSAFRNHNAVRLRNALQPRRKVWRLAYDCLLLRSTGANQVANNHKSCGNSYAGLERRVRLEPLHGVRQLQTCADGALCVVFVGLGVAKVDQHPVAHVLRYEAAEATHRLRNALLIGRNDLAEVFRVHAG